MNALLAVSPSTLNDLTLSLQSCRRNIEKISTAKVTASNLALYGEYLDLAELVDGEKDSAMYAAVLQIASRFIEKNLRLGYVQALAEQSAALADLVEAELTKEEVELTLTAGALSVQNHALLENMYDKFFNVTF